MSTQDVNFAKVKDKLETCCRTEAECGQCDQAKCLIGFAKIAAGYASQKNTLRIKNANNLFPKTDYKIFDREYLAGALLEILLQCKNCQDNHEEDCAVNVIRLCLEFALIGDNLDYRGSTLAYLMALGSHNAELSEKLLAAYNRRKQSVV